MVIVETLEREVKVNDPALNADNPRLKFRQGLRAPGDTFIEGCIVYDNGPLVAQRSPQALYEFPARVAGPVRQIPGTSSEQRISTA